jgi:hypothetical protein
MAVCVRRVTRGTPRLLALRADIQSEAEANEAALNTPKSPDPEPPTTALDESDTLNWQFSSCHNKRVSTHRADVKNEDAPLWAASADLDQCLASQCTSSGLHKRQQMLVPGQHHILNGSHEHLPSQSGLVETEHASLNLAIALLPFLQPHHWSANARR